MKCKNIPNILSAVRLALVVVFALVFFLGGENATLFALIIFIVAGLTDVVDGFLARRNNWITDLGKILDPLADKMMQCTALICLCVANMVEVWFVIPYILKEIFMLFGGFAMIHRRRVVVVSNIFGKLAAFIFYAVIGSVMLWSEPWQKVIPAWVNLICGISLGATLMALAVYVLHYVGVKSPEDMPVSQKNKT